MIYRLLLTCCLLALFTSNASAQALEGKFTSGWAMTLWEYTFNKDGSFVFTTEGHFGDTETKGFYHINGDTLYLNNERGDMPTRSDLIFYDKPFLMKGDSCIFDYSVEEDYCRELKSYIGQLTLIKGRHQPHNHSIIRQVNF